MPKHTSLVADLPTAVAAAVWRGDDLAAPSGAVVSSGWEALDAELPGGGWPCGSLTEVLSPQPSLLEWRLLGPALGRVAAGGGCVLVVGPPKPPYLPGLEAFGLSERHLIWVQAEAPAQRLWVTEQLVQADIAGAVLAWLPQARSEQLRRLQSRLAGGRALLVALRPEGVRSEASPAGLRVLGSCGPDWSLRVQLLKRRGPTHEGELVLPAVPPSLEAVLTRRTRQSSRFVPQPAGARHAVVRAVPARRIAAI